MRCVAAPRRAIVFLSVVATLAAVMAASGDEPEPEAATVRAVVDRVGRSYVDPSRVDPRRMAWGAATALDREVPEVILESSLEDPTLTLEVGGTRRAFPIASVRSRADLTRLAEDLVRFVRDSRPATARPIPEYVAINGMLSTLDPHSILFDPREAREFRTQVGNLLSGIGITIDATDSSVLPLIRKVWDGGPAQGAGVAVCDQILAVEGRGALGVSIDDLIDHIKGPTGTELWITLLREGVPREFRITRGQLKLPSVTTRLLEGGVGLIQIDHFGKGTAAEVETGMADLRAKGAQAWLLDLRLNPGGVLSEAVRTASIFVPSGPLVTIVDDQGGRDVRDAVPTSRDTGPLAILIGPYTASAAELLTGALQNRDRAVVLGRTSFGKGSVQELFDYKDGSLLKLTQALYFAPGGVSLQSRGVLPDIELVPVPVPRAGRIRLSEPEPEREADLAGAFAAREPVRRAGTSISYLAASPDADEEIEIARAFLLAAPNRSRGEALGSVKPFFDQTRLDEDASIVRVLEQAGVDWSPRTSGDPPKLAVLCVQRAPAPGEERARIECDVRNEGPGDAYRVIGRVQSRFDLAGEEVVVGREESGKTRSVTIEGLLAAAPEPRVTYVPVEFSQDGGGLASSVLLRVETPGRPSKSASTGALRPEIRIEDDVRETSDDTYRLRASIRDPGRGGAWVRVSNRQAGIDRKKVAYERSEGTASGPALPIVADVPLAPGLNEIGVCVQAEQGDACERKYVFRSVGTR